MPRRCIISASPELARIASRRRGLIIHADMDSEAEIRGQTTLPPATVAAGRHPDAQGVRGSCARGGDEGCPVGNAVGWNSGTVRRASGRAGRRHPAATRAAWGEGRGGGIPLPLRRRHVTNQRSSSPAGMAFCSSSAADHAGPGMDRHSSATRPRSFRTLGVYITVVCIVGSGEPRLHAVDGLGADRPHEGLCVYYGGEYSWLRRTPAAYSGQHGCSRPRVDDDSGQAGECNRPREGVRHPQEPSEKGAFNLGRVRTGRRGAPT